MKRFLQHSRNARKQRGLTLVMTALLLFILLIVAALAVDLGIAYTGRTAAQHSADAAALAGAYTYVNQAGLTGAERIAVATKDGAAVGNTYKIMNRQVTISSVSQAPTACDDPNAENIICVDESKSRVTAVVGSPVNSYFAGIMPGFSLLHVRARAVAEAAPNAAGERCLKPFYLANDAISDEPPVANGNCDTQAQAAVDRCNAAMAKGQTIFTPAQDNTWELSDYAENEYIPAQKDHLTEVTDPSKCAGELGCPFNMWDKNSTTESQWGVVDFSAGQGNPNQVIPCTIANCMQQCAIPNKTMFTCRDVAVGLKTGQTTGQIIDELANLIGYSNKTPSSLYVGETDNPYLVNGKPSKSSDAVIPVIVWDCRQKLSCGTHSDLSVIGFARIHVNQAEKNGNSNAFLISAAGCDKDQTAGGSSVPIRLVNTNR